MTSTDLHDRTMCNVFEGGRDVPERQGKKGGKRRELNYNLRVFGLRPRRCDLGTKLWHLRE